MADLLQTNASPESKGNAARAMVQFETPAWVVEHQGMTDDGFARWVREAAALFRFSRGEITLGTAAALASVSQTEFMRRLKEAGLPTSNIDLNDLDQELDFVLNLGTRHGAGD